MKPIGDDAFIVMSGPPEKGKRERISKVRSHIKKGYFERKSEKKRDGQMAENARRALEAACMESVVERTLKFPGFSATMPIVYAALDGQLSIPESSRRVQKFIDTHVRTNLHSHPFKLQMMQWTIHHPHFTSGKLLVASGWDDLQEHGELSSWTIRQRQISIRLIEDALTHNFEDHKFSTVGAIQSLLGFEVLNRVDNNYIGLRKFVKSIIAQPHPQHEDAAWNIMEGNIFLLDHADALNMTLGEVEEHDLQLSLPVDVGIFVFGSNYSLTENTSIVTLLGELHFMLWIAQKYSQGRITQDFCDYVYAQWCDLYQKTVVDNNVTVPEKTEDIRASPIRLCIFMLATYLLGPDMTHGIQLSQLACTLQQLLKKTGFALEAHLSWMPFPGALICCYMVGLRFAEKLQKTWFTMLFMKLSHAWLLDDWEGASKIIYLVSDAVRKIRPLQVEEV